MSALSYPHGDTVPEPGTTLEVAPGVRWLRMPLPFALDHINLWLIDDGEGWAIVDTGLGSDETQTHWRRILSPDGDAGGRPVTRLLATHFHPDHMGQAGWLCAEHGVEMWTSRTEWMMARSLYLDTADANRREMAEFYRRHGVPEAWVRDSIAMGNTYRQVLVEPPARFRRVVDREAIEIGGRSWQVRVGNGHAPEHVGLWCAEAGLLISGDHILPKISPHIGLWASEPNSDPLQDYLDTLDEFRELPEDTLVLPSHIAPFHGLHARIDEIHAHHDERLDRVANALEDGPLTAYEAIPGLFGRQFDGFHLGLAMGECLAHLACLQKRGLVATEAGADGLTRFALARG